MSSGFAKASLRALLQDVTEDAAAEEELLVDDLQEEEEETADPTLDIRIAAVFCILVAGLAGGLTPLFLKVRRDRSMEPSQGGNTPSSRRCLALFYACSTLLLAVGRRLIFAVLGRLLR